MIASIRRGSRLMVPRGERILHDGDVLTFVVESGGSETVRRLCKKQQG